MKCKKCIKGIIMKQISLAEFTPIPCECRIEHEMSRYDKWFKNVQANP